MGTAPFEEAYLILELSKPWGKKIKAEVGSEPFEAVLREAKQGVKLLGTPRIDWLPLCHGPWGLLVRRSKGQTLVQELKASPEEVKKALEKPAEGRPLPLYLVCTHGTRDRCCGTFGYPIYKALADHSSRNVLQISHLGGHRYAPVLLVLPEWRFYGRLTSKTCLELDKALEEKKPYPHGHRGAGYLPARLQTVEGELWGHYGDALAQVELEHSQEDVIIARCRLKNGAEAFYRARVGAKTVQGFKNCDDISCGKMESFELPLLHCLEEVELAASTSSGKL